MTYDKNTKMHQVSDRKCIGVSSFPLFEIVAVLKLMVYLELERYSLRTRFEHTRNLKVNGK